MLLQDVVTQNDQAAFVNDVQLAWYPSHPDNLRLLKGYMFTSKALENKVPSIQLLKTLRDAFLWGNENRHVIIANYGHGKSHLALALANFFGKPADSEELGALLSRIAHVTDESEAQNLRDFKAGRPPFLVVRLRGDQPQSLHQQFVQALEIAIAEHPQANGIPLELWFDNAVKFFNGLSSDQRSQADAFLAGHSTDTAGLLHRITYPIRDPQAYDLCVSAFTHLIGTPPNFGGETSLNDIVCWAADTFCKPDNPLAGGILVLFDEFSAFVRRYSQRRGASASSLQDLLNGVANCPRKVVFAAFSQHDPSTVARDIYRQGGDELDSLLIELERLPMEQRHQLYSSLETVLDSYVQQTPEFRQIQDHATNAFVSASIATAQLLKPRYDEQMGWGEERFDTTVTYGCFPLHPLTTGILCSVAFKQVTNERTILGFVIDELKKRAEQPAMLHGKPNWVYPSALVDAFADMLPEREYREYQSAAADAGTEIPPVQAAVLKAILLYAVGGLKRGILTFELIASHLTGYPPQECLKALEALRAGGYIRYDETGKVYKFWATNSGATKIEKMVKDELQGRIIDLSQLDSQNTRVSAGIDYIEVDGVTWGNTMEWRAREALLTRKFFTAAYVKRLAPLFTIDPNKGLLDGERGCVIRLIATNEDDIAYFSANADQLLKDALGDHPTPILLCIPTEPTPHLCENLVAYDLLKGWNSAKRSEVSVDAYTDKVKRVENDIKTDMENLRGLCEIVVPQAFRAALVATNDHKTLSRALSACYRLAYPYAPQPYFSQHKASASSYRAAVQIVCNLLATKKLSLNDSLLQSNPVAKDLVTKFLRPAGWGILTHADQITPPTVSRIKRAWEYLDAAIEPGKDAVAVKDVLVPLLNPPFGYDYSQIALLFCAWYGYNRHHIKMTAGMASISLDAYTQDMKPARNLLAKFWTDATRISRRDPDQEEREIKAQLDRVKTDTFDTPTAKNILSELDVFVKRDGVNADLVKNIQATISTLRADIDRAKTYKEGQDAIFHVLNDPSSAVSLDRLLPLLEHVAGLPMLSRVDDNLPTRGALQEQVMQRVEMAVEQRCSNLEELKDEGRFALQENQLKVLKGKLVSLQRNDLNQRIADATAKLQASRQRIVDQRKDREFEAEIKAMQSNTPIALLTANLGKLTAYNPHSDQTKQAIEAKQAALQIALASALTFVDGLPARIDAIQTLPQVQALQEEINRQHYKFQDAPQQGALNNATERCKNIQVFLTSLRALEREAVHAPEDVSRQDEQLATLFHDAAYLLGDGQRSLLIQAQEIIRQKVVAKQTSAVQWLTTQEKLVASGNNLENVNQALLTPPAFLPSSEQGRLATLRANVRLKLDAENALREMQQKDAPLVAQIEAMSGEARLTLLRSYLTQLETSQPTLPATVELIAKKKATLKAAVERAENSVSDLALKVGKALDVASIRKIDQEAQRNYTFYEGTPEVSTIEAISAQCKSLEDCLLTRATIEQKSLTVPEDVSALTNELDVLMEAHSHNLSPEQRNQFTASKQNIQNRANKRITEAIQWLAERKHRAQTGSNPAGLLAELNAPPAFLPDDQKPALAEMRDGVCRQIESLNKEQEQKAKDAPIIAAVNTVQPKGSLAFLRSNLEQLLSFEPALPTTIALVQTKAAIFRKAIQDAEDTARQLTARLDDAVTAQQVREIEKNILVVQNRYADSPESNLIASTLQRCEVLASCFQEITKIEQACPDTPEDVTSSQNRLQILHQEMEGHLSAKQQAVFAKAQTSLTEYAEAKLKKANGWLERCEREAEEMSNPSNLLQTLSAPPLFLPASCADTLDSLRAKAQRKLDEDQVGKVVHHFKQITDQAKRHICLQQLEVLTRELNI